MPEAASAKADDENTQKQGKTYARAKQSPIEPTTVPEPLAGRKEVTNSNSLATTNNGNGVKGNPVQSSPEPVKEPVGTISQPPVAETSTSLLSAKEPVKEKKSLFKKIKKQIGDRALDILSDGGDNINVAGFAIRVEK
ncbi:hypothetical protein [Niabella hibiscisoli]|uniref:hypothetical protein n=1 Tax=Niabella hibiscisoli TaxID=1825928 RepID=UPI001F10FCDB|nr:hypothetical protein [Niabella hibiscisoli]MCH5715101.1 hypothetical protein [Niabella hibiscisoli]